MSSVPLVQRHLASPFKYIHAVSRWGLMPGESLGVGTMQSVNGRPARGSSEQAVCLLKPQRVLSPSRAFDNARALQLPLARGPLLPPCFWPWARGQVQVLSFLMPHGRQALLLMSVAGNRSPAGPSTGGAVPILSVFLLLSRRPAAL